MPVVVKGRKRLLLVPLVFSASQERRDKVNQVVQSQGPVLTFLGFPALFSQTRNCFNHCIPSQPSTSLSRSESNCLSACMEKYIDAWNITSRTYIARLSREAPGLSANAAAAAAGGQTGVGPGDGFGGVGGFGGGMQGPPVGKEMF